ncbi:MAG: site-2 protease family protein [Clostridia bacterium]|nr:site-2 protease family protein [Clostridia bacterium]
MLFNFSSISADPLAFIKSLLITLPGVLLALSIHECAHGWVAERCGDDTARYMGRITLNPMKHIDPMGFLCMLLVGFGWAKPVPVNPLKYKNYRADDLKVSLAGITANLCLFFVCFIAMSAIFIGALSKLGYGSGLGMNEEFATAVFRSAYAMSEAVIEPAFGKAVSVLYQMIVNCMFINLSLAVFNLIPLPPLDGYHVLNDLVLHQDLFAQRRTQQIAGMVLLGLIMLGNVSPKLDIISIVIGGVRSGVIGSLSVLSRIVAQAIGVI